MEQRKQSTRNHGPPTLMFMEKNVGFDFYKHLNKSNVINMKKCMDYAHKVEETHIKFNDRTNNRFIANNIFDER